MSVVLKAEDAVLVLIDHQDISMTFIRTQSPERAKANNVALAKAAVALDIPSVWSSASEEENKDWWQEGLEEVNPAAYENRIKRTGIIDSWNDPAFVSAIEATGRKSLIMSGTTTDGCLLYTALSAQRAGYVVHVVLDGSGSPFPESEEAARTRMAHEGIILTATNTVIGELAVDWSTPNGARMRQILGETFQKTLGGFDLAS